MEYYEARYREQQLRSLLKRAQKPGFQCIMKEGPRGDRGWVWRASAPLRIGVVRRGGPLGGKGSGVSWPRRRQWCVLGLGEWHSTLGERFTLSDMTFPPRRQ